jgi:hypothetical protein
MTFKRIKDYVLGLKEAESGGRTIVTPPELRGLLEAAFPLSPALSPDGGAGEKWHFTDAEMLTAVGHLENYGYVKRLRTSQGEERVLLEPEIQPRECFISYAWRDPEQERWVENRLPPTHPAVADLRESLHGPEMRWH